MLMSGPLKPRTLSNIKEFKNSQDLLSSKKSTPTDNKRINTFKKNRGLLQNYYAGRKGNPRNKSNSISLRQNESHLESQKVNQVAKNSLSKNKVISSSRSVTQYPTPSSKMEKVLELEKISSCSNSEDIADTINHLENYLEVQKEGSLQNLNLNFNKKRSYSRPATPTPSSSLSQVNSMKNFYFKTYSQNQLINLNPKNDNNLFQNRKPKRVSIKNKEIGPRGIGNGGQKDKITNIKKSIFSKNAVRGKEPSRFGNPLINYSSNLINSPLNIDRSPSMRNLNFKSSNGNNFSQAYQYSRNKSMIGIQLQQQMKKHKSHRFLNLKNNKCRSPQDFTPNKKLISRKSPKFSKRPRTLMHASHSFASLQLKQDISQIPKGLDKYTLMQQLGTGQYSKVRLAKDNLTDKFYVIFLILIYQAMKIIDIRAVQSRIHGQDFNLESEFELMGKLDHPNLVKVQEVIHHLEKGRQMLYVAIELVSGFELCSDSFWDTLNKKENLAEDNRSLPLAYLIKYSGQLISAVNYRKKYYIFLII